MINIPDRLLLLEVAKMFGAQGVVGVCMVCYALSQQPVTQRSSFRVQVSGAPVRELREIVGL